MKEAQPPLTLLDAVPASRLNELPQDAVLGVQRIGERLGTEQTVSTDQSQVPTQIIATPLLIADAQTCCDIWLAAAPCTDECIGNLRIRRNADVLFGVIEIDESAFAQHASPLRAATDAIYQQLFAAIGAQNYPHLWRTWNYIADIHGDEAGLERYRQFNIGRHQAFDATQRAVDTSPAASALGTRSGLLSVAFIAGRVAPQRIENPRQVSAYAYPSQYGPRSPAFSRAVTVALAQQRLLFVSGTASIVGHETVHDGDVIAQTRESMANISALLDQVNAASSPALRLQDLTYRVYVRHARDAQQIKATLDALLATPVHALYVQADVCRADLLVEIEAFAATTLTTQRA